MECVTISPAILNAAKFEAEQLGNIKSRDHCSIRRGQGSLVGKRLDVKTVDRKVRPTCTYNVHVAAASLHQQCDGYFFVSTLLECSEAWLLGWMPKSEFFDQATEREAGETDPLDTKFTFKAHCYSLRCDKLAWPKNGAR